jgi:hypothetical protein
MNDLILFETIDSRSLLIFYLLISSTFLSDILGCNIKYYLKKNWLIRNIVAIIILYVFVISVNGKGADVSIFKQFLLTLSIFIWFYLSRDMNIIFLITLFLLLFIMTVIYTRIQKNKKEISSYNQTQLLENEFKINRFKNINLRIFFITLIITFIGLICYVGEHKFKNKKKFSYYHLFISRQDCKFEPHIYSISDIFNYFLYAFK